MADAHPSEALLPRLHLIRHAHAGKRSGWEGDDELRPLSAKGWAQAEALADALADAGIEVLLSSPYVRCRQSLEPLAARLGLSVASSDAFAEGVDGPSALEVALAAVAEGRIVAVCSHGDVLPAVAVAAFRRGAEVEGGSALAKGARFSCTVVDGQIGRMVRHEPPVVELDAAP